MANLSVTAKLSATVGGVTVTGNKVISDFVLTAPEKQFADIITTSTSATAIALGSGVTFSNISYLYLENLSETTGENIQITKSGTSVMTLEPGMCAVFPPTADGTAMNWDADAGTPRLHVVAYGPIDATV